MVYEDDLATLWSLAGGISCIIRPCGMDWQVRVERDGVILRERTLPNSATALVLGDEWEAEFMHTAVTAPPTE